MRNVKVVVNLNKGLDAKVGMVTSRCEFTGEYEMVTKVTPKTITIETFRKDGSQANYFKPTRIRKADLPKREYWLPTMEELLKDEINRVWKRLSFLSDSDRFIENKDEIEELERLIPALEKCLKENTEETL